jgi:hypothetical protein
MADSKISALPASTTPLAGTEVLPIVQSSTTKQVSVANLTAGRAVSAASLTLTTTALAVTSGGTGVTTSTGTGNTVLSAAPTFSGDVTLSTGNVVVANGKGIDFSATPGTGTSELFADYEEGTWTPAYVTTGGSFTYSFQQGTYVKIGRIVYVTGALTTSAATVGTGAVTISGLPFATNVSSAFRGGSGAIGYSTGFTLNAPTQIYYTESQTSVNLQYTSAGATVSLNATNLTTGASGNYIFFSFYYPT